MGNIIIFYSIDVVVLVLPPFQITVCLIFLTPSLTTHLIQKFVENITSFVLT